MWEQLLRPQPQQWATQAYESGECWLPLESAQRTSLQTFESGNAKISPSKAQTPAGRSQCFCSLYVWAPWLGWGEAATLEPLRPAKLIQRHQRHPQANLAQSDQRHSRKPLRQRETAGQEKHVGFVTTAQAPGYLSSSPKIR